MHSSPGSLRGSHQEVNAQHHIHLATPNKTRYVLSISYSNKIQTVYFNRCGELIDILDYIINETKLQIN